MGIGYNPSDAPVHLEGAINVPMVNFFDDFTNLTKSATADTAQWTVVGTSAALTITDGHGGVGTLVSNSTNVASAQGTAGVFVPKAGRRIRFCARIGSADCDGQRVFVGLAASNLADGILVYSSGTTDFVGFYTGASAADLYYTTCKSGDNIPGSATAWDGTSGETDADTGVDLVNASISSYELSNFTDVSFEIVGTSYINYYVNDAFIATVTTAIPDDIALTPVFETLGSGETLYCDLILAQSER